MAVPSRVILFLSTLRLNLVLTHAIPPAFRGGVESYVCMITSHLQGEEMYGSGDVHYMYGAPGDRWVEVCKGGDGWNGIEKILRQK